MNSFKFFQKERICRTISVECIVGDYDLSFMLENTYLYDNEISEKLENIIDRFRFEFSSSQTIRHIIKDIFNVEEKSFIYDIHGEIVLF